MRIREVIELVEGEVPFPEGIEPDSRVEFGDPEAELKGIGVTWSATSGVIERAILEGLNLIITHESLFWPYVETVWVGRQEPTEGKPQNIKRLELLERGGICVYMTHKNWDAAPGWGMVDAFGKALGFERVVAKGRFCRVYEVEPISVRELALEVKGRLGLPFVRVAGDASKVVRRVGTAVGGLGQILVFPEELYHLGAEAAVFGEMLDYTMRCAIELGMPVIETSHVLSENFGVVGMVEFLRGRLPGIKVVFLDPGLPWEAV